MTVARAAPFRRKRRNRQQDQAAQTILAAGGALFSIVGLVIVIGGYLSTFYGSEFHMLAGAGLLVSGILLARRHRAGAWTYLLVVAAIIGWSLRDVETGAALVHRLVGPTLLLAMLAALMPALRRWQPRHSFALFIVLVAGTAGIGILSLPNGPLADRTESLSHLFDAQTKEVSQ